MTAEEMKLILNANFDRWLVKEYIGTLVIKLEMPIKLGHWASDILNSKPAGTVIIIGKLNFFERWFSGKKTWKCELFKDERKNFYAN